MTTYPNKKEVNKKDESKIGALWLKNKNDREYYTGMIELNGETTPIVVFFNTKGKPTHPDMIIHKAIKSTREVEPTPF